MSENSSYVFIFTECNLCSYWTVVRWEASYALLDLLNWLGSCPEPQLGKWELEVLHSGRTLLFLLKLLIGMFLLYKRRSEFLFYIQVEKGAKVDLPFWLAHGLLSLEQAVSINPPPCFTQKYVSSVSVMALLHTEKFLEQQESMGEQGVFLFGETYMEFPINNLIKGSDFSCLHCGLL